MPRTLTAGMQTAVAAETGTIVHFYKLSFSGGALYLTTAPHDVSWDSQTWTGIGGALHFSLVQESPDLSSSGVDVTLSGVDQTVLSTLFAQKFIGRGVDIWLGHFASDGTVIADPALIFQGLMNGGWEIQEKRPQDGRTGTVDITARCVDRLSNLEQRRGMQTNVTSHQAFYPNDLFFQFIDQLASRKLKWEKP